MKYVNDTKAAKSISAYILMRGGDVVGNIRVYHGEKRTFCNVLIDDYASKENYCLYGSASGYGYNKENAAIAKAIGSIDGEAADWDEINGWRMFAPASFGYDVTSKINSIGPKALEEIFNCTVLQAI